MARWRWRLTFYYGKDFKQSKKGDLAVQTVHSDEQSLKTEINVGKSRPEIGLITQLDLQTGDNNVVQNFHGQR